MQTSAISNLNLNDRMELLNALQGLSDGRAEEGM
jgi:hypothetical protein